MFGASQPVSLAVFKIYMLPGRAVWIITDQSPRNRRKNKLSVD